jgi:hypothetical protein
VQDAENPPKLVHEAIIATPDGERLRLVASNWSQMESVPGQVASLDEALASEETPPSLDSITQSIHDLAAVAVDELCAVLSGHDAFDVMSMLRACTWTLGCTSVNSTTSLSGPRLLRHPRT